MITDSQFESFLSFTITPDNFKAIRRKQIKPRKHLRSELKVTATSAQRKAPLSPEGGQPS